MLRAGPNEPYNTLKQAQEDGAVVMAYGCVPGNVGTELRPSADSKRQLLPQPAAEFHGRRLLAVWLGGRVPVLFARSHHQAHGQVQVLPEEHQREGE